MRFPFLAASGSRKMSYDAMEEQNAVNLENVVHYVRTHATELGVDPERIAIWACSANATVGLTYVLNESNDVTAAVFYYGVMESERPVRRGVPIYIARAGLDSPGINRLIDGFVERAVRADAEIELVNYPEGQHAFDVRDDTERSRQIIRDTLDFLSFHLDPSTPRELPPMTATRLYYMMLENEKEALTELARMQESDPANQVFGDMTMDQFADLLLSEGRAEAALSIARIHAEVHPVSPRAELNLAQIALKKGRLDEAESRARRTLQLIEADGVHLMVRRTHDAAAKAMLSEIDRRREMTPTEGASTALPPLIQAEGRNVSPDWSPDGTSLVFASNRAGDFDFYVVDATEEKPQ